jgi:hypothetical protein
MRKKTKNYLWQSVIGLGFLSGLWTAIGIDPEAVLITAAQKVVDSAVSNSTIHSLFIILPTILLLISIYSAYKNGKAPGLVSVIIAYFSGLLVMSETGVAFILLIVAIVFGWIATNRRFARKLSGR